ncbi:MAG TPA: M1 family metallopeptidase [Gemmatimonadaceae bacterium]|nr:M1 family metallopeptidase [Gemmatimonadaceae bacterium]
MIPRLTLCRRAARSFAFAALAAIAAASGASAGVAQRVSPSDSARAPRFPAAQPDSLLVYEPGIDVLDYALLLDLPDTGTVIAARATLTVRRFGGRDTLRLDLIDPVVDSVLVQGRSVRFRRDSAAVWIPLPSPSHDGAADGDTLEVVVRYHGAVRDGLVIHDNGVAGWTAFGDNWPDRARHWIPSVDHPSDKATVTWVVIAPADRRVVANGALMEQVPLAPREPGAAPRTLTRWRLDRPIPPYLMVITAAPLAYMDMGRTACGLAERAGCVPQSVYVFPDAVDSLPGPFANVAEIMRFFATLVAPFPYDKLAHVQSSTRFGGMENATAIFYDSSAVKSGRLSEGTVAHEMAHQWFGDAVTERAWGHLWLSEGFATYFSALWTEHHAGDSAFRAEMAEIRQRVIASPVTATRPVIDTAQTEYLQLLNTNSYQKGAWTLHMLRALVGDSAFFAGIRRYYGAHRHGTALTDDLRRAMEAASGESLGWFFDQWLRRPGYAEVTTSWRYDARTRRVTLDVEQGTRFRPYRFPLTIVMRDGSGTEQRVTVTVPAQERTRLVLPAALDSAPRDVVVDPDVQLLAALHTR